MRKDPALLIGGLIFAFIAIAHFLRLIFEVPIMIGQSSVPMAVSVVALIISFFLSLWMFLAVKSKER